MMNDFEKVLELMSQQVAEEPETQLPSLDEQKAIAEKLKQLEAEGKLTPEVLDAYFGQYYAKTETPIH
ncbi:restriction endonuclease subunit S [Vibrio cholerae]|nr:restriction endonuclease subunit S [Vibrio cholerae]NOE97110.1 restriction endonuclease subunit S [Vibrio cholerae]NOE98766.1 restriction endonuclease subunit S [Vibrio cholerae]NOF15417.1 restriction endonuclease subunit S [Vibrio cholerae]NOF17401.1 restriction endonuclease subunit S [Vibrio cholerae]